MALAAFSSIAPTDIMTELAAACGLVAGAMLLMQFLSSGRLKTVSSRLGLDVAIGFHRAAATTILLLVAAHVVALGLAGDEWRPGLVIARVGRLVAAQSARSGVLATATLVLLFVLASGNRSRVMRYEVWRIGHGLGALAVVALSADHAWRLGAYVREPAVALAFVVLAAAAVTLVVIIYAVRPLSTRITGFSVQRVRRLSRDIVELVLKSRYPGSFRFRAGQFVWATIGQRHPVTDHPFSIASSPEELPLVRFLIREVGDTTRSLTALQPGLPVGVDGPHGNFTVEDHTARSIVLVAGGIGIAPVLGILRSLQRKGDRRPIRLLVAGRSARDLVEQEEIAAMTRCLDLQIMVLVENAQRPTGWSWDARPRPMWRASLRASTAPGWRASSAARLP
ncbi:ferric reductase-like transmembrane domain-containing protein [Alsobacter soli]|uniref:ferric reductase-like transmembrane domain-containing protein n=1 Tax=Alsobacter soli TaxID=2109933 RepID=UPI00130503B6|nr:ferric reductase-like transmembrane domain-containing protein [Alsobacter soli]